MEGTSDTLLVTTARDGDPDAYGELFARYQSRIYNYAYGIAGNREDAADIAQEAFVRVFEALPRLAGELNFSAYVYRTTHNVAIDLVRGRSRFDASEALDVQMEPSLRADPERVALVQEQQNQAWQAAFMLSGDHRSILTLRELHDLSYQEIAEIMDMPRNTVGVLLSRARLRFKEAFRMSSVDIDRLTAECRDMLPLLSAYIDDELDEKKRARVESHLEECAFCRLALEEMTESSRSYRAILPLLPPAALGEGIWGRLGDLVSSSQTTSSSSSADAAGGLDEVAGPETLTPKSGSSASTPESGGAVPAPRSGRRYLRPRMLAFAIGGVVIVALVTLGATGTLGGSGGSGVDDRVVDGVTDGGLITEALVTTTTDTPTSSATATISTQPPTTVSPTGDAATIPGDSVVTGSTTDGSSADGGSGAGVPDPSPTTVTEGGDTAAPPTPGIVFPAAGETVQGSKVVLRWTSVKDPSGVTYRVEVESFDKKAGSYVTSQSADGVKGTELAHVVASTIERWRVTAVDGAGNSSKPSVWAKYANPTFGAPPVTSTTTTTLLFILPGVTITLPEITTSTTAGLY